LDVMYTGYSYKDADGTILTMFWVNLYRKSYSVSFR